MRPFFSIITVSLNAEALIKQTILSVINQTFGDFEIIIKDGNSTDGTRSKIPIDSRIRVFCETDTSIYDAMNQAVQYARGEYCVFLNCGDIFASDDVLEKVYAAVSGSERAVVVYGDYSSRGLVFEQASNISRFALYRTPLCHQSMFISTSLFQAVGVYNCTYRIMADYDFTLRSYFAGVPLIHIPVVICDYLGNGVSESLEGIAHKKNERIQIVRSMYPKSQRIKYDILIALTLRKLRIWLASARSPKWVKQAYRRVVNFYNRG